MEGVDARLHEDGSHLPGVFEGPTARHEFIAGYPDGDGEVAARPGLHAPDHVQRELEPSLDRAPVGIGTPVAQGREEGARQQVAVRAVELEAVEAGFPDPPRGLPVSLDDLLDLVHGELATDLLGGEGHGRAGAHGLLAPQERERLRTRMDDLRHDLGAVGVDDVGQLLEAGDLRIVPEPRPVRRVGEALVDRRHLEGDEPHSASGASLVVVDHLLGDSAVVLGPERAHRSHDDAVAHLQAGDLDRAEQPLQGLHLRFSSCRIAAGPSRGSRSQDPARVTTGPLAGPSSPPRAPARSADSSGSRTPVPASARG